MTRGRWFGTLRLRSGQALKSSIPKAHERGGSRLHQQLRTSGRLAPTSTTAHERGGSRLHRRPRTSRAYIDNGARAGRLAPTSTTVRGRGRPRHTRRGPGRGVSRTPSLKSREDRHPPLTAESNSSAENLGHSPEG